MEAKESERFAGLDLLRGIAALSVLTLHLPWPATVREPFPRGYLAVDLFFVLSGFVIAQAYSERLGTLRLFKQFCLARLIRLYPLYCMATLIGAAEMYVFARFGSGLDRNITAGRVTTSLATAIFFLPTPGSWSVNPLFFFPLVYTAWSLFWELLVNLIYGIAAFLLRPSILALLIGLGAIGVFLAEHRYGVGGLDAGGRWDGAWVGGARALFSYFAGVAIFQLRKRYRAPRAPALLLVPILLISFIPEEFGGKVYELSFIALLSPLLVWFGADATIGERVRASGLFVGFLSYPIYLLQAPILVGLAPISIRLERIMPTGGILMLIIAPIAVVFGSWLFASRFDLPVREWLRRRIVPLAPVPQAQSAP